MKAFQVPRCPVCGADARFTHVCKNGSLMRPEWLDSPAPVAYSCPRGLKRCWCSAENVCAEPAPVAPPRNTGPRDGCGRGSCPVHGYSPRAGDCEPIAAPCAGCAELKRGKEKLGDALVSADGEYEELRLKHEALEQAIDAAIAELDGITLDSVRRALSALRAARGGT